MPDNPNAAAADLTPQRIVAYGVRNTFRMTTRPGTDELWLGDVGWDDLEEINRLSRTDRAASPTSAGPASRATAGRPATTPPT